MNKGSLKSCSAMMGINGCKGLAVIRFGVSFINLPWRSRHFHDRRTKEVLQCNEEAGIQETTETYTSTSGKNCAILMSSRFREKSQQYINYNKISHLTLKWFQPFWNYPLILNWNAYISVLQENLSYFLCLKKQSIKDVKKYRLVGFWGENFEHTSYWTMAFLGFWAFCLVVYFGRGRMKWEGGNRSLLHKNTITFSFFLSSEQIARSDVWYCNKASIWHHCYGSNLS